MSVYELLGREHGIRTAVDRFYERVLADPQLADYFTGVDMNRLRWHQVTLLSTVTGGPATYEGRDLGEAHAHLDISGADFDRVVAHLDDTLEELGVDAAIRDQVAGVLLTHRAEIVSESTPATS